jgi:hypothetical protein
MELEGVAGPDVEFFVGVGVRGVQVIEKRWGLGVGQLRSIVGV